MAIKADDWQKEKKKYEREPDGGAGTGLGLGLGAMRRVDNKAGDKRYLLRIDNLNSLKCIRISLRDCRRSQRELETIKKLSALTRRPGMDKRAPGGLNQRRRLSHRPVSLESKKTFRLQIKKKKENSWKTQELKKEKKKNFEKRQQNTKQTKH